MKIRRSSWCEVEIQIHHVGPALEQFDGKRSVVQRQITGQSFQVLSDFLAQRDIAVVLVAVPLPPIVNRKGEDVRSHESI